MNFNTIFACQALDDDTNERVFINGNFKKN